MIQEKHVVYFILFLKFAVELTVTFYEKTMVGGYGGCDCGDGDGGLLCGNGCGSGS